MSTPKLAKVQILLASISVILLDCYFKLNAVYFNELSPFLWLLALAFVGMGFSSFWAYYSSNQLVLPLYAFPLLLFLTFYVFRLGIDFGSWGDLKSRAIGTTGGVILFYFLGAMVSGALLIIDRFVDFRANVKLMLKFLAFNLLVMTITTIVMFSMFLGNLRDDLLLVLGAEDHYQRPGAFITCSLLLSFTCFYSIMKCRNLSFMARTSCLLFMVLNCGVAAVTAQLLGSNNGTVNAIGVLIVVLMVFSIRSDVVKGRIPARRFTAVTVINVWFRKGLRSFGVLAVLGLIGLSLLSVDLTRFRMFGFGSGDMSSIASRFEVAGNFPIQFAVDPFWGNMKAEVLTTGEGTYIHSFLMSIASHLGLFGLCLFLLFVFLAIVWLFKVPSDVADSRRMSEKRFVACKAALFLGLLSIATFGNFFTVSYMWFLIGLLFPIVQMKKRFSG